MERWHESCVRPVSCQTVVDTALPTLPAPLLRIPPTFLTRPRCLLATRHPLHHLLPHHSSLALQRHVALHGRRPLHPSRLAALLLTPSLLTALTSPRPQRRCCFCAGSRPLQRAASRSGASRRSCAARWTTSKTVRTSSAPSSAQPHVLLLCPLPPPPLLPPPRLTMRRRGRWAMRRATAAMRVAERELSLCIRRPLPSWCTA